MCSWVSLGAWVLAALVSVSSVLSVSTVQAQARAMGTASGLDAVASDGTRVHIGEITGEITITPATRSAARFGRVHVRAGLELDAVAGPGARLPAYVEGEVGALLHVEGTREAHLHGLRREGAQLLARIVLGDAELEDVPVRLAQIHVEGDLDEERSVAWRSSDAAVATGASRLCRTPNRACVRLTTRTAIPVSVLGRRGGWTQVVAEARGLRLGGWVPSTHVVSGAALGAWGAGRMGALSDGCPYEGTPALVAAGTPVSLEPAGARWARIPDEPDSVWVHDTRPGTPWVEITFARGVQRSFPGSTCSLGWVPRASVTFHHLREGALSLSRAIEGDREVIVLHTLPAWLTEAGLVMGDRLLAVIERGARRDLYDLDGARQSLGIGGTFVVLRAGREQQIRVLLAPGCEEPGAGQSGACRPR